MRFVILSEARAERFLPDEPAVCVSITGSGAPPARLPFAYRGMLRVTFDDVPLVRRACPPGAEPCTVAIADEIARFVVRHLAAGVTLVVVHCAFGASRSPGVALGLADGLGLPVEQRRALAAEYGAHHRGIRRLVKRATTRAAASSPDTAAG